jgi:dissimilatory sulfite reductase (desulfoviridin) alpha/beta subunit
MNTPVTVTLELSDSQALALAQFVKRVGWSEFRSNAVDDVEAREIRSAVDQLQHALADAGYAPR